MAQNGRFMHYALRLMQEEDIPQVAEIDREAFPENWPPPSFRHELRNNKLAHYLVAWDTERTYADWRRETGQPPLPEEDSTRAGGGKNRLTAAVKRLLHVETLPRPVETEDLLVGYLGLWAVVDEGHIISVGVRSPHRGKGIGELLIIGSIELSQLLEMRQVTLECRVSNVVAQNLYQKYGFKIVGRRKGYYTDNHEDAFVMTTDDITTAGYQQLFNQMRTEHSKRWGVSPRYYDDGDEE